MVVRNTQSNGTDIKSPQIDKICGLSYNKPVRLTLNGRRLPSKVRFGVQKEGEIFLLPSILYWKGGDADVFNSGRLLPDLSGDYRRFGTDRCLDWSDT